MTSLVDGSKVTKFDLRLETYGTVDELNSHLGLLIAWLQPLNNFSEEIQQLLQVQNWLFCLGSQLACSDPQTAEKLPSVNVAQIQLLENQIDQLEANLPSLKNFILPGGSQASCQAHICRTVTRRTERVVTQLNKQSPLNYPALPFLNRLSDYFFVLSRTINHRMGIESIEWVP